MSRRTSDEIRETFLSFFEERGHTVATSGPYRYVRHPGYVGAMLAQMATPLPLTCSMRSP